MLATPAKRASVMQPEHKSFVDEEPEGVVLTAPCAHRWKSVCMLLMTGVSDMSLQYEDTNVPLSRS